MSSGMNLEQAKEYAKAMTYSEAVANVRYSKGIKYRKATMIKLRELAEIADKLDTADTMQKDWEKEKSEKSLCNSCGKYCDNQKRNLYVVECNRYEPQTVQKLAEFQKMCSIKADPDRMNTECGWK